VMPRALLSMQIDDADRIPRPSRKGPENPPEMPNKPCVAAGDHGHLRLPARFPDDHFRATLPTLIRATTFARTHSFRTSSTWRRRGPHFFQSCVRSHSETESTGATFDHARSLFRRHNIDLPTSCPTSTSTIATGRSGLRQESPAVANSCPRQSTAGRRHGHFRRWCRRGCHRVRIDAAQILFAVRQRPLHSYGDIEPTCDRAALPSAIVPRRAATQLDHRQQRAHPPGGLIVGEDPDATRCVFPNERGVACLYQQHRFPDRTGAMRASQPSRYCRSRPNLSPL